MNLQNCQKADIPAIVLSGKWTNVTDLSYMYLSCHIPLMCSCFVFLFCTANMSSLSSADVMSFMSAGSLVRLWGWRCAHVIPRASLPHVYFGGVWRTAVHDPAELYWIGHHEWTTEYVPLFLTYFATVGGIPGCFRTVILNVSLCLKSATCLFLL